MLACLAQYKVLASLFWALDKLSNPFLFTLGNHSNDLSTRTSIAAIHYTTQARRHPPPHRFPSLPPSHGRCLSSISQPPRDSSSRALTGRWCARHLNSLNTLLIIRLPTPIRLSSCPKYSQVVCSPICEPWHRKRVAAKLSIDSNGLGLGCGCFDISPSLQENLHISEPHARHPPERDVPPRVPRRPPTRPDQSPTRKKNSLFPILSRRSERPSRSLSLVLSLQSFSYFPTVKTLAAFPPIAQLVTL